jgi:hypothetical protein
MSRLAAALLCAAVLPACKKPHDDAPAASSVSQVNEVEPNDDAKTAQSITGTAHIRGKFASGDHADADWYKLVPASVVVTRLEFSGVKGTGATLSVYDTDQKRVLEQVGPSGERIVVPNVLCKGVCYVRLLAAKADVDGDYTLRVTPTTLNPRQEREPNNRAQDAQPLAIGATMDGFISPADDEDWYLLSTAGVLAGQMLAVSVASPAGVRLEMDVVRQSDLAVLGTYRGIDVGEDIRIPDVTLPVAPETGLYFALRSALVPVGGSKPKRQADSDTAYTLEVKTAPAPANVELEPNQDAVHATPLLPGAPGKLSRAGFIAPKGDVDWFTFHVAVPSIVRADVTGLDNVHLVLALIDPAKRADEKDNELARSDTGDVKDPQAIAGIPVPAGDNYIVVQGAARKTEKKTLVHDFMNTSDTYTLTVTVEPDDGNWEHEPNNKPDDATTLEVGRDFKGYIWPAGDVDYWKLEIKESTNVAIAVSAVAKLDLKIIVRDATRKGEDGQFQMVGMIDKNGIEAEERLVIPFEPGTYLVEIREKGKEYNAQAPYTLSVK